MIRTKLRCARFHAAVPLLVALAGCGRVHVEGDVTTADGDRLSVVPTFSHAQVSYSPFAGSSQGFRDGPLSDALFLYPNDICSDRFGNLYVADTGNDAVRKITPDGMVSTFAGAGQRGHQDGADYADALRGVAALFCAGDGSIYAGSNRRVNKISIDGTVSTITEIKPSKIRNPNNLMVHLVGITGDDDGNLYVVDRIGRRVSKITAEGQVENVIDTPDEPHGLILDDKTLFVNENEKIFKVELATRKREIYYQCPRDRDEPCLSEAMGGMLLDGAGNLLISDFYIGLLGLSSTGELEILIDFDAGIDGICIGSGGELFFASAEASRIYKATVLRSEL